MSLRENVVMLVLFVLLVLTASASYYRFMVLHDYLVSYEIDCDPNEQSCFVGCEDEECVEQYYFAIVERHATEVESLCGVDITNCEDANSCSVGTSCRVVYCDQVEGLRECDSINNRQL